MGVLNSGVVYALWDYSAAGGDELSFREGQPVTVLRRQPPEELDWWWGSLYGHEGYVPRNYFGVRGGLAPLGLGGRAQHPQTRAEGIPQPLGGPTDPGGGYPPAPTALRGSHSTHGSERGARSPHRPGQGGFHSP